MAIDTYVVPSRELPFQPEAGVQTEQEMPLPITFEQIKERLASLTNDQVTELLRANCEPQWQALAKETQEQGYKAGVQRAEQVLAEELNKIEAQKKQLEQDCGELKSRLAQMMEQLPDIKPTFDEDTLVDIVAEGCFKLVGEQLVEQAAIKVRVQALVDKYQRRAMTQVAVDKDTYAVLSGADLPFRTDKFALVVDDKLERGSVSVSFEHGEMKHSVKEKAEEFFQLIDPKYQVVRR